MGKTLTLADRTTTDRCIDSDILDIKSFSEVLIHIIEEGKNAIKYNILACIDQRYWKTITLSTQVVTAGTSAYETLSDPWAYVKVRYASNASGAPGKILVLASIK